MSESVEILIKADDKASKEFRTASDNINTAMKRVEQITKSLETTTERYEGQLKELQAALETGAISADEFAEAHSRIESKIRGSGNAIKDVGGRAKSATEFVGVLASMTGNSQLAGLASQLATATEKVGQFSEVAKAGKGGAMAFRLGLMGLAAAIGATVGKALGDIIFQTAKFEREVAAANDAAKSLDKSLQSLAATMAANKKEDIELIRDPEAKRAAYTQLFKDLDRDIQSAADRMEHSKKVAEEWAEAWQITGNRKQYAIDAQEQLDADKEKLANLKEQRDELVKIAGARAMEVAQIKAANEAKEKSEDYLDSLRKEIEYLNATREEQIKLDAARNTTAEDQGEAERLIQERDAIIAKKEAEKELEQARIEAEQNVAKEKQKAEDDAAKARQKAIEEIVKAAAAENQRLEDIKKSEKERLQLQRIELEQGAEAAKVQELVNKGIDETTAKEIAAEEAAIERLKQKKADEAAKEKDGEKQLKPSGGTSQPLQASESRLLSRGSENPLDKTNQILEATQKHTEQLAEYNAKQLETQQQIAVNTGQVTQMVPIT